MTNGEYIRQKELLTHVLITQSESMLEKSYRKRLEKSYRKSVLYLYRYIPIPYSVVESEE